MKQHALTLASVLFILGSRARGSGPPAASASTRSSPRTRSPWPISGDYSDWIEIRSTPDPARSLSRDSDCPTIPILLSSGRFRRWRWSRGRVPDRVCLGKGRSAFRGRGACRNCTRISKSTAQGETLVLTSPGGESIDRVTFGPIPLDASYGRRGDGWVFFEIPTPGRPNGAGFPSVSGRVTVQPSAGFYGGGVTVTLSADPGETVTVHARRFRSRTGCRISVPVPCRFPRRRFSRRGRSGRNPWPARSVRPLISSTKTCRLPRCRFP